MRNPTARAVADAYARRATEAWRVAESLYGAEELASLPLGAVEAALGLGHPVRDAALRPGEVVLDVGCGAGIDLILAARAIAPAGSAIGLDLTPAMAAQARAHAAAAGPDDVQVLVGAMEELPLPDNSVDVVVSNRVVNLSADKDRAFAEAYRVLKPGGRMVAADMLLVADLPPALLEDPKLWSG